MRDLGAVMVCLALAAAPGDTLAIDLAEGAKLIRNYSRQCRVELTAVEESFSFMGRPFVPIETGRRFELGIARLEEELLVLADEYERRDESSWTVRRTFQEVHGSQRTQVGHQTEEREGSSKLADETVVLLLTSDEEGASVDPVSGSFATHELLPTLGHEMNLRGLLPKQPLSPGSRWEADLSVLQELLTPGGELGLLDDDGSGVFETLSKALGDDVVGSVTVHYAERLEDTARLSVLVDVETSRCSPPEVVPNTLFPFGGPDAFKQECFSSRLYLEGEVQWDLDAGRFRELKLGGDLVVAEKTAVEQGSMLLSSIATWEGSLSAAARVEADSRSSR